MAELPIRFHNRQRISGLDGIRWHVGLDEDGDEALLVVELTRTAATQTGLSDGQLDEHSKGLARCCTYAASAIAAG
jgi:hypothetical protein